MPRKVPLEPVPRRHDRPAVKDHRLLDRKIAVVDRKIAKLRSTRDLLTTQRHEARHALRRRLKIPYLPDDPRVCDALEMVDVEPGDVWRWHGQFNNYDVAVVRWSGRERSAARLIAIGLGLLDDDEYGAWYPQPGYDTDDMNPQHRYLRASGTPMGNAHRFDTSPANKPRSKSTTPKRRVIRLRA